MLRIYPEILDWLGVLVPLIDQIAKHDSDLAKQLRRSSRGTALNCAEGMVATKGNKRACYGISLREARESLCSLEIGARLGYIELAPPVEDLSRKIVGTLYRLTHPRR
jgi:four helix bundle protein